MDLLWLPRANAARHAAIEYIAQHNPHAALAQLNEIERHTNNLLQYPEIGRAGRIPATRELVIIHTNFVLIYRVKPRLERIEIVHLLHTSQAWSADKN